MKKLLYSSLFVLLSTAGLCAQASEAYAGLGSTGLELGVGFKLPSGLGLRAEVNFLDLGHDFNSNGADYSAKLKFQNLGAYLDYYLGDSFRLTGGVLLGGRKLEGRGVTTGGVVTINGTAYPAPPGESVTVTDTFPDATPYLGLGFGHGQKSGGWGFYFDAGVAIGKGETRFTVTPGLVAAAGQANVDAEQAKVRDKLDKLKAFPVVKLGVSYGF